MRADQEVPPEDTSPALAKILFQKIEQVREQHPDVAGRIDALEEEIKSSMADVEAEIAKLEDEQDQKLVTVYVINEIHRSVEGILTVE